MSDIVKYETDDGSIVGLEDFDLNTEATTPRINIAHTDGVYKDNQSGYGAESFDGVILGLVKQRVLWPAEMEEGDSPPLCRSFDFHTGHPNPATFPLRESKLKIKLAEGATAPCGECYLKEWDSHPTRDSPWCTEQHVLAVLADISGEGQWIPSLLTFQRSSLKPSRTYLSSFARSKIPTFSVMTSFGLNQQRRGSVRYCVPTLTRGEATDKNDWEGFAELYRSIRHFLQTPRTPDAPAVTVDDDDEPLPEF